MKLLTAGLAALAFVGSSCISPGKVNYGHHLESEYRDTYTPTMLARKKEKLAAVDFRAYLRETKEYLLLLNESDMPYHAEEFHSRLELFHDFLQVVSGELYGIENVAITTKEIGKDIAGTHDSFTSKILLKKKYASLSIYTHEFGHHTDRHNNLFSIITTIVERKISYDFQLSRMRTEAIADAFRLTIADELYHADPDLAISLYAHASGSFFGIDEELTLEDLLSELQDEDALKYYRVEKKIVAVLYHYHCNSFKETWDFLRKNSPKKIIATLKKIEKGHGSFSHVLRNSILAVDRYFDEAWEKIYP